MMRDLVIITGASRGIGKAIKENLSKDYVVVGIARSENSDYECDLSDLSQIPRAFSDICQVYGPPKILINCAGFVEPKGILEMNLEEIQQTLLVNLGATIVCTQQFVKHNKSGGKIINIASTAGQRPSPGWSAYAASKAGVINFSLTMASELRDYNIQVYCIAPGRCATELRRKLAPEEDQSKIMQPSEVSELVGTLINDDNLLSSQVIVIKRG
jgi:short-subunit dehydrogenase